MCFSCEWSSSYPRAHYAPPGSLHPLPDLLSYVLLGNAFWIGFWPSHFFYSVVYLLYLFFQILHPLLQILYLILLILDGVGVVGYAVEFVAADVVIRGIFNGDPKNMEIAAVHIDDAGYVEFSFQLAQIAGEWVVCGGLEIIRHYSANKCSPNRSALAMEASSVLDIIGYRLSRQIGETLATIAPESVNLL